MIINKSEIYPIQLPRLDNFAEYNYFETAFLPHEVTRINQYWDNAKSEKAILDNDKIDEDLRKSKVVPITPNHENQWIYERMMGLALQCNYQRYGFELSGIYEPLQLAEYTTDDLFDWHLDFGKGQSSNRKLSVSIQLSSPEEYDGGELQFQINTKQVTATKNIGSAIVFPSFIMHRVTKVTKGKRRSIVGWISGPPFK